jgi:hypothetical protein
MVGMVAIIEFLLLSKFPFARGYFIIGLWAVEKEGN